MLLPLKVKVKVKKKEAVTGDFGFLIYLGAGENLENTLTAFKQ